MKTMAFVSSGLAHEQTLEALKREPELVEAVEDGLGGLDKAERGQREYCRRFEEQDREFFTPGLAW